MKPLTVEQLKNLEVWDWVWIIDKEFNVSSYKQKLPNSNERYFIEFKFNCEYNYSYSRYGTKWIAYKNKEQAEE